MRACVRRGLGVVGALLAVAVGIPLVAVAVMFGPLAPAVDGTALPGGARLVRDGRSNVYVLPAGEGVALVDCGNDREGGAIRAELRRRGLTERAVRALFLTHGHRDHLGACRLFPEAEVFALAEEVPVIEGASVSRGLVPRLRGPAADLGVRVSRPLRDGEVVRVGALATARPRRPRASDPRERGAEEDHAAPGRRIRRPQARWALPARRRRP